MFDQLRFYKIEESRNKKIEEHNAKRYAREHSVPYHGGNDWGQAFYNDNSNNGFEYYREDDDQEELFA
tara:strand:- start:1093 stop:1296 length:204 start_codon:yes stop_codon:yes gene_type:complete